MGFCMVLPFCGVFFLRSLEGAEFSWDFQGGVAF